MINKEDYGNNKIYCPLLGREIWDAYCYEINEVRTGGMVKKDLEDDIDTADMIKHCEKCEDNPLPNTATYIRE